MPAKKFFAAYIEAKKLQRTKNAEHYKELCDIVFIAQSTIEYQGTTKKIYEARLERLNGNLPDRSHGLELSDPIALNTIVSALKQKRG